MGNETECEHFTWRLKVLYKVHRGGEETGERGAYSQSYGFLLRRRGRKITIFFLLAGKKGDARERVSLFTPIFIHMSGGHMGWWREENVAWVS